MSKPSAALHVLVPVLVFAGCHSMSCCSLGRTVEGDKRLELEGLDRPALDVRSSNGSIRVEPASDRKIVIEAKVRARTEERLREVAIVATPGEDGLLEIHARFPGKRYGNEGCSFRVLVPATRSLRARTSNGRIELKGLEGPATLVSSNGAIVVEGHQGPLELRTSNGAVRVRGATARVVAETSNGAIHVELDDQARGPVRARTSNGAVRLTVGSAFAGVLEARTSNGRITTRLPDRAKVERNDRHHVVVRLGNDGERSEAVTSNGSITIGAR